MMITLKLKACILFQTSVKESVAKIGIVKFVIIIPENKKLRRVIHFYYGN